MDEFAMLDEDMTQVSDGGRPARRAGGSGSGKRSANRSAGKKVRKREPLLTRLRASVSSLSKTEQAVIAAGIAIAVIGVALGSVLIQARAVGNALRSFAEIGNTSTDLTMIGIDGITAVEQAAYNSALAASKETVEPEETLAEEEMIEIEIIAQTVKGDLKIKFIDKETSRVVEGVPFAAQVTDPGGKKEKHVDDDKNGIIYLENIDPGDYKVEELPVEGKKYKQYTVAKTSHTVTVSNVLAYTEIDVSDEVKDQSEVNVAQEDNMAENDTPEEGHLENTEELVASSKTLISGGTGYAPIPKSDIADPYATAKAGFTNGNFRYLDEDLQAAPDAGNGSGQPADNGSGQPSGDGNDGSGNQGVSTDPASQGVSTDPASQGVSTDPASQGGSTDPASQGVSADPASQGGSTVTAGDSGNTNTGEQNGNDTNSQGGHTGDAAPQPVRQVIGKGEITVTVGQSVTLSEGSGHQSDNSGIASVSGNVVTGVAPGECQVAAQSGNDLYYWRITVQAAPDQVNDNADLKDKQGRQVYVKEGNDYRRAVNSDYRTQTEFFVMVNDGEEQFRYTGWQTINGKSYYFDKNGNMLTGAQVIGGVKYNFDETGALASGTTTLGIDVSQYNGAIDWAQVKNSGISFAIIRLGYRGWGTGVLVEDSRFRQNIQGAIANGIRVGVYFVTQAVNEVEAVEEASMVLGIIRNYSISYPVFLDVETSGGRGAGRADQLSVGTRTAVCNAFCRTISNGGYRAGVYANKNWLDNHIDTPQIAGYNIWMAQYHTEPTYTRTKYDMWQYTSSGSVAGIGGRVDMNISYTSY